MLKQQRVAIMAILLSSLVLNAGWSVARTHRPVVPADQVSFQYKLVHAIVSQTAVSGRSLFWTQTVPPRHGAIVPERLYYSQVSRIVRHLIYSFPQGTTVLQLEVSAKWVAANLSGTTGSAIWAYNRTTHRAHTIAFFGVNSGSAIQDLVLSDGVAGYVVDRFGKGGHSGTFEVRRETLPNGPRKLILSQAMKCGQIALGGITGGLWIGEKSYKCSQSDVIEIDPAGGQIIDLTVDHHSGSAFTNGVRSGWLNYRTQAGTASTTGEVELQGLNGSPTKTISHSAKGWPADCRSGAGRTKDDCAELPGITDSLVYWINGLGNPTVYDLATHRSQILQTDEPPSFAGFGQGSGRYISWPSSVTQPTPGEPQSYIVVAHIGAGGS